MTKKGKTPDASDPEDENTEVVGSQTQTDPGQQDDAVDWETRFKGLQRSFDRKQKELSSLQEKFDSLSEEAETSKQTERERQAQLDALQKDLESAKADLDKATGELATQEARGKRIQLIMSDFPELSKFEAAGLLPSAETEEEMAEKFTAFRDALNTTVQANVKQQVVGASPAKTGSAASPPAESAAEVYSKLTQLAGARDPKDRAEYERYLALWDDIQNNAK